MARYPTRAPLNSSAEAGGVAAVDRALMLLGAFSEGDRSLSLQELAARTSLVRSTVLRLLVSLQHFGLVQKMEDNRYALGPATTRLQRLYTASFGLETVVPPALRALVDATRESASFHVRQGEQRLVLFRVHSSQPLSDHSSAGDLFPLNRGTGGHVIMAFSGAQGALYDRIRRERVVALVGDRVAELAGVSSPVFDTADRLVGAITLTMPRMRYREGLVPTVRAAAADVTRRLGGSFETAGPSGTPAGSSAPWAESPTSP
jgi:DNA-binding IclR family transcriptional regulator